MECRTGWRLSTSVASLAAVLGIAAPIPAAAADPYPSRAVKIVVPYSPGGGTDVVTRTLAQRLTEATGQAFVVENRPGADATIGPAIVAKTAPDGYTLLATSGVSFLITRSSMNLSYDPM
jgi:tripartite-type tricarboxylate transporter receptor subunit TctC